MYEVNRHKGENDSTLKYRTEYDRDYARVLHSASFRRLQNKTQLFPGQESDYFRNRLTHSLEVSQIASSIARKLICENPDYEHIIEPKVCEIAGLVHDIGHPPFGHNGEMALDENMRLYGGFEGNAQTIRILTRLEKKERPPEGRALDCHGVDQRCGLNLTSRVIAAALKYDHKIPIRRAKGAALIKGYYDTEADIVDCVKRNVLNLKPDDPLPTDPFKTIECSIMDIADDIAYSTYDVEDAFKAGFLTPLSMLSAGDDIFDQIAQKVRTEIKDVTAEKCRIELLGIFKSVWDDPLDQQIRMHLRYSHTASPQGGGSGDFLDELRAVTFQNFLDALEKSEREASDGYYRTELTSNMVNHFIDNVEFIPNEKSPLLSSAQLKKEVRLQVLVLKHFSYVKLISSPRLKVAESRGKEIINRIFSKLKHSGGEHLLPDDTRTLLNLSENPLWRNRVICDFISGMTDRYVLEFYGRLFSENPQSIFKPLF